MGDPKKPKKKYETPSHPWQAERIGVEGELVKDYGFKNKKEIWKITTMLKKAAEKAKRSIIAKADQAEKEKNDLVARLARLGLVQKNAQVDAILGLQMRDLCERRLQTLVFKKGLAKSINQARQFIVHRHIMVNGRSISSPNFIVPVEEEATIAFSSDSTLSNPEHPERAAAKAVEKSEKKEEKKSDKISDTKKHGRNLPGGKTILSSDKTGKGADKKTEKKRKKEKAARPAEPAKEEKKQVN